MNTSFDPNQPLKLTALKDPMPLVPTPPSIPFVMHGSIAGYLRVLGVARPVLALGLTLIILWRFGFLTWILTTGALLFFAGLSLYLIKSRKITCNEDSLTYRKTFGTEYTLSYTDIESVKVFMQFVDASFGPTPRVSIAAKDASRYPIVLHGYYWQEEDMKKLAALLEKKTVVEQYEEVVAYSDIVAQFPLHSTYIERHTIRVFWIILSAVLIVTIGIALLMTFVW